MRVLVTGVNGLVGSRLAALLERAWAQGHRRLARVRNGSRYRANTFR